MFKKVLLLTIVVSNIVVGAMTTGTVAAAQMVEPAATATANNFKYGDVNMDDAVDSVDLALMKAYLLAKASTLPNITAADVTGDGTLDALDYAVLKKYLLGLITTLPADGSDKILIPHESWTCGMAAGIPKPEKGVLVFETTMKLQNSYDLGKTQYGQRKVFVVQSGSITGSKIQGSVLSGGIDFQLTLSNGAMEIEQLLMIKVNDGNYIYLRSAGTAVNENDVRMVWDFEAPNSSSYNWLNSGKYVGRRIIDSVAGTMKISVYDVSGINFTQDSTNSLIVTEPSDVPNQPWDFRKASSERNGSKFITEAVSLGGSQSVGASKRGNRNIIPITGGTVTGNLTAKILPAGADYQNLSNPMTIDARYLWQTDDGEIIIVRNGGQFGSLVPTFEVRADSKYSYLNQKLYLSSDPGGGAGGVTITFYESIK
ncbi:DUF3237 family protein [Ruminiclostridium papyrosolvens]|uniref:cellulase n=1 Tax=Ruminiclostridium papyrosolvens C7 TaxID=1330534 RepID=U4R029_9FIRM|nr:DUF3237 family protein [Ruminiclostridium papyrosolvens]EPR10594.1 cellulosome protein dockerin type I [Ruminiclostridium papyrosolvens C7]